MLLSAGMIAAPLAYFFVLHDYQRNRVTTFLDPEEGVKADKINERIVGRPWELWKRKLRREP